jgi:hypothetical protein
VFLERALVTLRAVDRGARSSTNRSPSSSSARYDAAGASAVIRLALLLGMRYARLDSGER